MKLPKNPYTLGAAVLAIVVVLAASYIGVTRAYQSVFNSGVEVGRLQAATEHQAAVIQAQEKALAIQTQLLAAQTQYQTLYAQFQALEQASPKEVVRYVRQDPAFAAAKRPADLHALRVRELQQLRQAAATR